MTAEPASKEIAASTVTVDGVGVFCRRTQGEGAPVVFSHGNPTHSGEWVEFMRRLSRPAIAFDLPGWGRSARPRARDFDYSVHGLARFFGRCLDALGVERYGLVAHDWGSLALIEACRRPERVERLVVINAVPLLPGYRWHWIARWFWRVPLVGEFFNLTATKSAFRLISRQATSLPGPLPEEFVDMIWESWPGGANRPVLELYRSADPDALAAAGTGLGRLACPALVVWGVDDPYIPVAFGPAYARRLPDARLLELPKASHWPWIDRPEVIDDIVAFLADGA